MLSFNPEQSRAMFAALASIANSSADMKTKDLRQIAQQAIHYVDKLYVVANAGRPPMTSRQKQVYEAIMRLSVEKGYPPTIREIGIAIGTPNPNGVLCHLGCLVKKGYIARDKVSSRGIRML
jgi:hypothetical protein